MKLIINGKCYGRVNRYEQDRENRRWIFILKHGLERIAVDWDAIKYFDSCGKLDIIVKED